MKKRLLIILGAGSSVEQDFPTTGELDREVSKWARDYAKERNFDAKDRLGLDEWPDYFGALWRNREGYCAGLSPEQRAIVEHRTAPNYERILGDMHLLMNAVLNPPFGDPMLQWLATAKVFAPLGIVPGTAEWEKRLSSTTFHSVQGQLSHLTNQIAERIRGNSRVFEFELKNGRGTNAFAPYQTLFARLAHEFEIGVYNLNYDTVGLAATPDAFVGFDRSHGDFLPSEVLRRSEWKFLYHLHGSVHHRVIRGSHIMEDDDFGSKIVWHDDLWQRGDTDDWQDLRDLTTASDGKRVVPTSIVAGGWKLDQLLEEPFLTFYSCFRRHVHEADAILIGGYGFGDPHVNSILTNALRARSQSGSRPPILVIDHDECGRPLAKRAADPWKIGFRQTLRAAPQWFRSSSLLTEPSWMNLPDQIPAEEFEVSADPKRPKPVAVWSWGFTAAAGKLDQIANWLSGDFRAL